jgi:dCMP deaminase
MEIAYLTSQRSNCIKRKVGAIIVKDNRILSQGYNGTPSGFINCFDGGCKRCNEQYYNDSGKGKDLDLCICLHAEENCLLFVSKNDLLDSTIYTTLFPCIGCLKKILQCKIKRIVYKDDYNDEMQKLALELIKDVKIIVEKISI